MPSSSDDTEQFAATPPPPSAAQPRHAARSGAAPISRGGWWAITIVAAVLLILGFLLTFGPARYWTPVPAVFLGYFLISGVIGLVFWKGVRELRDSNPTLHTGDGPASPGARVAAAVGAVGIASALVLLPAGLSDAPANALPCPDGSNTCGPTAPTLDQGPTQGGGNTTAPQAPATTIPGYTPPEMPTQPQGPNTPTFQGTVMPMPTVDKPNPDTCIFNCDAGRPTPPPQTGQGNPPQTGQQQAPQTGQNPVTTAPQTVATTPQAPTSTPQLRTPTVETTTTTSQRDRDSESSRDDEDEKNSGIPYQAAEIAALAGTYRRRKQEVDTVTETAGRGVKDLGDGWQHIQVAADSNEVRDFVALSDDAPTVVSNYQTVALDSPVQGPVPGGSGDGSGPLGEPVNIAVGAWEYSKTFRPDTKIGAGDQQVRSSIEGAWAALNECYSCVFPIGGAPERMPKVGDVLPLSLGAGGHFSPANIPAPLKVTQMERTADAINIEYETIAGHPDGVGSTIHFTITPEVPGSSRLRLDVVGKIIGGPGSAVGSIPGGQSAYTATATAAWQQFIDNLQVKGALHTPPPGMSYA